MTNNNAPSGSLNLHANHQQQTTAENMENLCGESHHDNMATHKTSNPIIRYHHFQAPNLQLGELELGAQFDPKSRVSILILILNLILLDSYTRNILISYWFIFLVSFRDAM